MKIVDLNNSLSVKNVFFQLINVYACRYSFQQNIDALPEDWDGGEADDDREEVGTERVCNLPVRFKVDDHRSDNDAHAHEHVSQYMKIRTCDIDVLIVVVFMAVIMVIMALV